MAFHTASTMTAPITATRVETMKPCCSYSNPPLTARKMNPPANAPTSPNAILTRQPLPCLPMMRLASQPTMAPNTIQPSMTIPPLRYRRFTYTMVPVAAESSHPAAAGGDQHQGRHHRHRDHAIEHGTPIQRLDGIDGRPVDAQA